MKIAYVNKNVWLSNMPATVFSTLNAYGFAQNGADSWLIMKENEQALINSFSQYFDLPELGNFHTQTFSDKKHLFQSNEIFYKRIEEFILEGQDFDVVVSRDPGFLPNLVRLKKKAKIKVFYQSHNFYMDTSLQPEQTKVNKRKFYLRENRYLPLIDGLLAINNPQKELYAKYVELPIFAGKPGLKDVFDAPDNFDKRVLFYSGSFQVNKGVEILLDAYSQLKTSDVKLILAGGRSPVEIDVIKTIMNQKKIRGEVIITGWMPYAALLDMLKEATVGVIPLKDTFYNRYLTAPSKLFDYLSFGVPIVASDLSSLRDFLSENQNALFVEPNKPEALAQAIDAILSDRNRYDTMRERNHDLAKSYLWETRTRDMLDFMESIN